ncbi:protein kinase domain-containing protein [Rheinheimera sp. NSM]|uniref:protein kinase domain-containing protein n=1 Tax=Rheinheimera sp. NSM TaxID=3457884 RepID=UPI00403724FF
MSGLLNLGFTIALRYEIVSFIGEGGMQHVYKSRDIVLDKFVALKTPKNNSAKKRFHRSAIVSAKVNHPNVAKTLDYVEESGHQYLIEELVEGEDLSKAALTKAEYLDPSLAARIFHCLSKGLAASHHVGVIHRDLKPTNIMVTGGFNFHDVKITDFGIAKLAEDELIDAAEGGSDTISASATAVGALPYMAPEAIDTPKDVGLAADVWSLGAILYELISGKKPFGSGLKAVGKILTGQYEQFPEFVSSNPQFAILTQQLMEIVKSCLNLDPAKRPTADNLVVMCSDLCYQVSDRYVGFVRDIKHNSWGFISLSGRDVFFHYDCVYGYKPKINDKVLFSKYSGGGADRALPVVKLKLD